MLKRPKLLLNASHIFEGSLESFFKSIYRYTKLCSLNVNNVVLEIISELDLVDIRRDHNPKLSKYTRRKNTPLKQALIDLFLILNSLYSFAINSNIDYGYRTDHNICCL